MALKKGIVQSFDGTHAVVVPNDTPEIVTLPLLVPFIWRETMGNLQAGEEVYYMEDEAHSGVIISRTDGAWDNTLRGSLTITENVTMNQSASVANEVSAQMVTASSEATAAGISLTKHTHIGNMGTATSSPI